MIDKTKKTEYDLAVLVRAEAVRSEDDMRELTQAEEAITGAVRTLHKQRRVFTEELHNLDV